MGHFPFRKRHSYSGIILPLVFPCVFCHRCSSSCLDHGLSSPPTCLTGHALAEALLWFRKTLSLLTVTSVSADLVLPSVSHTITLQEGLGSHYGSSCVFMYFLCILTPSPQPLFACLEYEKQLLIFFFSVLLCA